jgi:hypothetical protein
MVPKIGEGEARFWDILVKVIAAGIAIGTVVVGCKTLQRQGDQLRIQQKQLAVQQGQFETTSKEHERSPTLDRSALPATKRIRPLPRVETGASNRDGGDAAGRPLISSAQFGAKSRIA